LLFDLIETRAKFDDIPFISIDVSIITPVPLTTNTGYDREEDPTFTEVTEHDSIAVVPLSHPIMHLPEDRSDGAAIAIV
jgi:hypothetical protein